MSESVARQLNEISGHSHVGTSVQARHVEGGIHLHAAGEAGRPIPRQLPTLPVPWTDRAEDSRVLDELRASQANAGGRQLIVVSGVGGIGKTAMITRWLWKHLGDFPDGQLYADLKAHHPHGPAHPHAVLPRLLRAVGAQASPDIDEQLVHWRTVTADLRIAVMLDDAATVDQVRPLLPSSPHSLTIISSRRRLSDLLIEGACHHHLRALDETASAELLMLAAGDRAFSEPDAVRLIAQHSKGHPLVLRLTAGYLGTRPKRSLKSVADTVVRPASHRAQPLTPLGDTVTRSIDTTYTALVNDRPEAARTYRALAILPASHWDAWDVAAACNLPRDQAQQHLDVLLEHHLLQEAPCDRYRFHDLVRDHAHRTMLDGDEADDRAGARADGRDEVVRRYREWLLRCADEADRIMTHSHWAHHRTRDYAYQLTVQPPFAAEPEAITWLEVQQDHYLAVIRDAAQAQDDAMVWQLTYALWPMWHRLRPYQQMVEAHQLALAAARRCKDVKAELIIHNTLGNALRHVGRYDEALACYQAVSTLAREVGDQRMEAQGLSGYGSTLNQQGDHTAARPYTVQAMELRDAIGHVRGAALSRVRLGQLELKDTRPLQAVTLLSRARVELLAEHDRYDSARALAWLGRAYAQLGDPTTGHLLLTQAMEEYQAINQRHGYAYAAEMRGAIALEQQQDTDAARSFFQLALATYQDTSPRDARRLRERLDHLSAQRH